MSFHSLLKRIPRLVFLLLISGTSLLPARTFEIEADREIWIRETHPTTTYEDDGISVWSGASPDGGRRDGLIQFDLSPLAGYQVAEVTFDLYSAVHQWSDFDKSLKQTAALIDGSSGTPLSSLTWNSFMAEKFAGRQPLDSLGVYDLPPARSDPCQHNAWLSSRAGTADIARIQNVIDGNGILGLVLIAEEDGTDYGQSWGDGDTDWSGPAPRLLLYTRDAKAYAPYPSPGASGIPRDGVLTWKPGLEALSHHIYLGTDYNQVSAAADPCIWPGRGHQSLGNESYAPPTLLDYDTTYYWRIDEVQTSEIIKGSIWQFTTVSGKAHHPFPSDRSSKVSRKVTLRWSAGPDTVAHHVYLGTQYDQVLHASDPCLPPGRGYQPLGTEHYTPEDLLQLGTTYYWRTDEVHPGGVSRGSVWSFTVTAADPTSCDGIRALGFQHAVDINNDCYIDWDDFILLATAWLDDSDLTDFASLSQDWRNCYRPDDPACQKPWRYLVATCLDTLIEHGTDVYGSIQSPMLMSIIDANTLTSPENPRMYDSDLRTEGRPDHGRLSPAGSNAWLDQPTIKAMYLLSEITGTPRYAQAADAYLHYFLQNCRKSNNLLIWGSHIYWHCYRDAPGGDGNGAGPHEILIKHPDWTHLYRLNPAVVRAEVEGIWQWHIVNHETGWHNRHDDGQPGCDFAFSGGSFALAFAFMHSVTSEQHFLDKSRLVADWHWNHRDPCTGLVPDAPGLTGRYDGHHCMTSTIGPHVSQLLRCYELTGDDHFRDITIAYVKAYDRYGWDPQESTYWGMLALDGTPVTEQLGSGYGVWAPYGHIDLWRTTMYSYEFPLVAAQTAIFAYELSDYGGGRDPALLKIAQRWADVIEDNLPPQPGRRWKEELEAALPEVKHTGGTYAENYGRAISFFVHLYRATLTKKYLRQAEDLAREAVEKLYQNGLFLGHPAKPYYQANDGVGFLLHALLELDQPLQNLPEAF